MNVKLTNDENIANLRKRKILRIVVISFSLLTILLTLLYFLFDISIFFAVISFVITHIFKILRDKTPINKKDDGLDSIRKEIRKSKERKK